MRRRIHVCHMRRRQVIHKIHVCNRNVHIEREEGREGGVGGAERERERERERRQRWGVGQNVGTACLSSALESPSVNFR